MHYLEIVHHEWYSSIVWKPGLMETLVPFKAGFDLPLRVLASAVSDHKRRYMVV